MFCVSDGDYVTDTQTPAAECYEVVVSNIPATDTEDKLTAIFESSKLTGVDNCNVVAVTYDSSDPTRAIVKFSSHKGSSVEFFWLCVRPSVHLSVSLSVRHTG